MSNLSLTSVSVRAGDKALITDISFTLSPGELVVMIGPNGAGKTTALRTAMGLITPAQGEVSLNGAPLSSLTPTARARKISYLPQSRPLAWPARVADIIALGRFAYGGAVGRLSPQDSTAVEAAAKACAVTHLLSRRADTLSGGEAARMHLARVFAAQTPLLIADEPVAALDPRHQFRIMDLVKNYVERGGGALIVLHDLSLAMRYADRIIALHGGQIVADGPADKALTERLIAQIYGVKATITTGDVILHGPTYS